MALMTNIPGVDARAISMTHDTVLIHQECRGCRAALAFVSLSFGRRQVISMRRIG